jgi:hypothetical protein
MIVMSTNDLKFEFHDCDSAIVGERHKGVYPDADVPDDAVVMVERRLKFSGLSIPNFDSNVVVGVASTYDDIL